MLAVFVVLLRTTPILQTTTPGVFCTYTFFGFCQGSKKTPVCFFFHPSFSFRWKSKSPWCAVPTMNAKRESSGDCFLRRSISSDDLGASPTISWEVLPPTPPILCMMMYATAAMAMAMAMANLPSIGSTPWVFLFFGLVSFISLECCAVDFTRTELLYSC